MDKLKIVIVIVAYKRIDTLERLLNQLNSAIYPENVDLIISIDKSNTDIVEVFADNFHWLHGQKIVIKHSQNMGLKPHILSLSQHFEAYDALVVLEDDLLISKYFYSYVVQTLNKYFESDEIAGISLYNYPLNYHTVDIFSPISDGNDVYFMSCAMSWGQVWMKKQFLKFYEWYEKHKDFKNSPSLPTSILRWGSRSWLKYHTRYCIENDKYFVYPHVSLTSNPGEIGEHSSKSIDALFQVKLLSGPIATYRLPDSIKDGVVYDGFFENIELYKILKIPKEEICLDIYGDRDNRERKRYWLTRKSLKYKIIKSYGLSLRPIEENIIQDVKGSIIFLYDCTIETQNKPYIDKPKYLEYMRRIGSIASFVHNYGIINMLNNCTKTLISKFL